MSGLHAFVCLCVCACECVSSSLSTILVFSLLMRSRYFILWTVELAHEEKRAGGRGVTSSNTRHPDFYYFAKLTFVLMLHLCI